MTWPRPRPSAQVSASRRQGAVAPPRPGASAGARSRSPCRRGRGGWSRCARFGACGAVDDGVGVQAVGDRRASAWRSACRPSPSNPFWSAHSSASRARRSAEAQARRLRGRSGWRGTRRALRPPARPGCGACRGPGRVAKARCSRAAVGGIVAGQGDLGCRVPGRVWRRARRAAASRGAALWRRDAAVSIGLLGGGGGLRRAPTSRCRSTNAASSPQSSRPTRTCVRVCHRRHRHDAS